MYEQPFNTQYFGGWCFCVPPLRISVVGVSVPPLSFSVVASHINPSITTVPTCVLGQNNNGRGPSTVPVARYSACEIAWHRWEQPVVISY